MTSRRPARLAAALAVLLLVLVGLPAAALAHAELDTAAPSDKSSVVGSPTEVVMTFTQNLDAGRSTIRVVDASGAVVAEGGTVNPRENVRTMRLALTTPLEPGSYTIRWTSFSSEDNEQARGTTTFTVTAAAPSPTVAPSAPPTVAPSASPSVASIAPAVAAPSPSTAPTTPTASTTDALIPIVVVVLAILGLGAWFAARSRRAA